MQYLFDDTMVQGHVTLTYPAPENRFNFISTNTKMDASVFIILCIGNLKPIVAYNIKFNIYWSATKKHKKP